MTIIKLLREYEFAFRVISQTPLNNLNQNSLPPLSSVAIRVPQI
jgi:hypothetical protein